MDQTSRSTIKVPERPFELPELSTSVRRPNCGVTLGDASVGAALLEAAQTALGLAEAEITSGRRTYRIESYRRTVPVLGPPEDSTATQGTLADWPVQSADPDSLRRTGFVQGDWPGPSPLREVPEAGPTYFAPDARVLFSDWFLGTHCISVDTRTDRSDKRTRVIAQFKPAKGTRDVAGLDGCSSLIPGRWRCTPSTSTSQPSPGGRRKAVPVVKFDLPGCPMVPGCRSSGPCEPRYPRSMVITTGFSAWLRREGE